MTPRKILVVLNETEDAGLLRAADAFAQHHEAELIALVAVEQPHDLGIASRLTGRAPEQLMTDLKDRARHQTRALAQDVLPDRNVTVDVTLGKAFIEIIRHVTEHECDFVMKTAEPLSGLHSFLFASTDQHLLRKCPCPVWLRTPDAKLIPKRIIATVDLDISDADEPETLAQLNREGLAAANCLAAPDAAETVVLHAWEAIGEGMVWAFSSGGDARVQADTYVNSILDARQKAMVRFLQEARAQTAHVAPLTPLLIRGTPETVIQQAAEELGADVVVMGTVARTGVRGVFIGNTAENIINRLTCSVLAIKPQGFVSPLL